MRWLLLACWCGCGFERHETPPAPRLIAPLSTSFVNSARPTFRFALPPPLSSPSVEISRRRDFSSPVHGVISGGVAAVPERDLDAGTWFWRVRADSPMGPATSAVWQVRVMALQGTTGTNWGSSLDVDGDGYDELAVGAPNTTLFGNDTPDGRVWVFFGGPNGPDQTRFVELDAPEASGQFGFALATVDFNGDGYADLAVGAPTVGSGAPGAVYLYYGGPSGLPRQPSQTLRTDAGGSFGWALDGAGDFDGDGFGDLVIGAPTTVIKGHPSGMAYVFSGAPTGFGQVAQLNPEAGSALQTGLAVAGGGDIDGDGISDVAIGLPGAPPAGHAWVIHGGVDDINPSMLDPSPGPNAQFGYSLVFRGDVDGDGLCDLAVSAPHDGPGRVYLYSGRAAALPVLTTHLDGSDGDSSQFGVRLAAGDADGDGISDLAVAAPCAGSGMACDGSVHLYTSSPASTPFGVAGPSGSSYGTGLSLGDQNGDGKADLAVGTAQLSSGLGRVDWYRSPPSTPRSLNGSDPNGQFGYCVR